MTLIVDNSILRATAECSTKALLEMGLGWQAQENVAPLELGKAVHEALAAWLGSQGNVGKAMAAFAQAYQEWSETNLPATDQRSYRNTKRILEAWFRKSPFDDLPYEIVYVEQGFHFPLTEGITYVGLLDGLGKAKADGSWRVIEHKTTGALTSWWAAQWQVSSQVTGYLWGASEVLGEQIVAAYINGVEFPKPYKSDKACREHGVGYQECGPLHAKAEIVSTQRTQGQIEEWKRSAIRLARRYEKLIAPFDAADVKPSWEEQRAAIQRTTQEGTFTGECRFCQFAEFCRTGRRHQGMLVQRPWDPMARAQKNPIGVEG